MKSEDYFDVFVVANFTDFWIAEEHLTEASKSGEPTRVDEGKKGALRAGMNAATAAYHFADAAYATRPVWMGTAATDVAALRRDVEARHCFMQRTTNPATDLSVLGAVVDAYKHFHLTSSSRAVKTVGATIVVATGWGELGWGEGKYGGVDQVIVQLNDGSKRALSSILQNVIDMWRRVMGVPLKDYGL